ncbi:Membrane-bound transcription factor site-2 protease [Haplosporangium sp. Z 767]|nr:Membrane-bound transcription factor site-2 protease [Haplosporangium sp. Z 767]
MGLTQLLVPFLATWFSIHAFLFLLQRFLNRPNLPVGPGSGPEYELLPTSVSTASTSGGQSSNVKPKTPSSILLVKPFHVRFSTTGLNSFFFRLGNSPRLARFWRVWYGLGVMFGMLAMVLGWALLAFAAFKLLSLAVMFLLSLWPLGSWESEHQQLQQQHQRDQSSVNPSRLRKRDLAVDTGAPPIVHGGSSEDDMVFIPVIPGVTFPLSHLPYYLLALLVSGVIHEAGHAIAAAREKIQVSSTGIFLYILYPGAFVDISSRAMAIMTPLQQLRVICAGVWHNAVLFGLSWIFLASGALQLSFKVFGWIQMDDGLSVVDVAQQSALRQLLKPGYVIRQLDDMSLKGDPLGIWLKTLSPQTIPDSETLLTQQESGFCIPDTLLFVKPSDCCLFTPTMQFGHSSDQSLSCFTPFDPSNTDPVPQKDSGDRILAKNGQCLPSVDILLNPAPPRCTAQEPKCGDGSSCYRPFSPYRNGSSVRLYYTQPSWMPTTEKTESSPTRTHVVLYQGDPEDIYKAVQVTTMGVRWSFLPLGLPQAALLTIQYTMSFSLALSVLNIVPARHLDGHHALMAFVAAVYSIQRSYRTTRSIRASLAECLFDNGAALSIASSSVSTSGHPKGSKVAKAVVAMGIYEDEDEDDFEVSTPRSIRIRNAIPPKARLKRPTYRSEQQQQQKRTQTQKQKQQQQRQRSQPELPSSQKQHVQEQSHDPQQQTFSQPKVANESTLTRPRNGSSLSLRRPAPKRDVVQQRTATPPELKEDEKNATSAGVIVLDSESEGHSDVDAPQIRQSPLADLDLLVTQFGGVSPASTPTKKRLDSQRLPSAVYNDIRIGTGNECTQESISSSQGSVDLSMDPSNRLDTNSEYRADDHFLYSQGDGTEDAVADHGEKYQTSWSISPQTTNPFLTDLVATVEPMPSTSSPESPQHQDDTTIFSFGSKLTSDCNSTMQTDEIYARTLESDAFSLEAESGQVGRETMECVICGKSLAHLDQKRIEYHINICMDEQQEEQRTIGSLDLESAIPSVSSSQGQFAGAQVDYLTRVMRCPICKLDWPLKSKSKAGTTATTTQIKKAKQKVEHMKRCAKAHKRTVQSLLYQLRLLKEKYERSVMLGTSMDSDPAEPSQEMMDEVADDQKDEREDTPTDNMERLEARKPKARADTITQRQVVSLADNADADFTSDAIITTVQTRVAPTRPKLTKIQRMEEDQQDDGLQLALAISMSIQSGGSDTLHGSSLEYGATSTIWSMAPLSRSGTRRGDKRRKLANKNETTVLPVAEVQQLIQANVDALLFPETDCSCDGPSSNASDQCLGCGNERRLMKTPPWRPSRFTTMTSTDLQVSLSQSSLPDTTPLPSKSLWDLSHHNDRDVDSLDLCTPSHRDASDQQSISERLEVSRIDSNDSSSNSSSTGAAVFDSEQYVARFLKQLHMRNHKDTVQGMPSKSTSTFDSKEYSVVVGGSGSNQSDSKSQFSSPLWSASKTRRISFKDHMRLNEDTFSNALKREIIGHLKLMEQDIQRAKRTAYLKIIESLKRHPIAARLGDLEPKDPIILGDEDGPGSSDESIQDPDGYQEPLSPLLRFTRASEMNRPLSPTTNELYSSQSNENVSLGGPGMQNYSQDQGECEHGNMSMDPIPDDQRYGDNDFDQNHSGILVYSPPMPPQAISSTSVDVDAMPSDEISFRSEGTPVSSTLFSSPGDLPPPLDFTKLGYHSAASVSNLKPTTLSQPVSSPASSDLPHWSLPVQLSETNDGEVENHLAGEGLPSNWANITTPKRNKRHLPGDEHIGLDVGDDISPARMPERPRSARKTRTILSMPLSQPEPLQQQQSRQRPERNVLHGLPLLKVPVTRTPSVSEAGADRDKDNNDDDMDFEQDVYPSSQLVTFLSSQATDKDSNRGSVIIDVQDFGMAARNNHLVNGTGSGPRTPTNRRKTKAVLRAEAFVAETAKAVANIKAQKQMPDYARMSVPRLRLVATTFGLKGGNKGLLVEQLTSIWQKLHPNKSSDDVDEGGEGASGGDNGGQDVEANRIRDELLLDQDTDDVGSSHAMRHGRGGIVDGNDPVQDLKDSTAVSDEDDEEDDLSSSQVGLDGDDDDDDDNEGPSLSQQGPVKTTPILERQLFKFLNSTPHLRKQFLTYKV